MNIRDYQLLKNEYLAYRLIPQRLEMQNAFTSYLIASMFGGGGTSNKDILDFMIYSHKDKKRKMDNRSIMNAFRVIGKKSDKPTEFTQEQIQEFNKLEALMIATGY